MNKYYPLLAVILIFSGLYYFTNKDNEAEKQQLTPSKLKNTSLKNKKTGTNIQVSVKKAVNTPETSSLPMIEKPEPIPSPFSRIDVALPKGKNIPNNPFSEGIKLNTTDDPIANMPKSYPVMEAEKYFLPPQERTPGHIGGPPPLNFPSLKK